MDASQAKKDFFISRNGADSAWAEWIAWQLEEEGYSTVLQDWDFRPGSNFVIDMQKAAVEAQRTIAVLSSNYLASRFTQPEWAAAFADDPNGEKGLLVPVRVEECDVRGLLPQIVYIDFVGLDQARARDRLLSGIERGRAKPKKSPVFPGDRKAAKFPGPVLGEGNEKEKAPTTPPVQTLYTAHERNPYFTGRDKILNNLRKTLERDGKAALSGLPGVGKTQTAREYAHRHRAKYDRVLWVTADSEESLGLGFASLARELDLPEKDEKDQSVVVEAAKHWLSANDGWLLIVDNADDLLMARPFVPSGGNGHRLLTTRASATGAIAERVEVSRMGRDEGALFLLRRAKIIPRDAGLNAAPLTEREAAKKFCGKVGGLPLALDQAGAFVEENQTALQEYLDLYCAEGKKLRAERGELEREHASVALTFSLAFQKVAKESQAAADLMRLCAFLAPDAIPEEVITEGASDLLGPEAGALGFLEAVKGARRYSLIERHRASKTLEVHRLVQDVVRDGMEEETRRLWAERAVSAVNSVFPNAENFETWPQCERVLAHARAAAGLVENYGLESEPAGLLTVKIGFYLQDRAQYDEAEQLCRCSLAIYEKLHGSEHPNVASVANNIGTILKAQGDLAGALEYIKRALAIDEKVYGPEQPKVAIDLNNIGQILKAQGDLAGALEYAKRALAIDEKVYGPEHPTVANRASNIGTILQDQGDLAGARPHYERALRIFQKFLGDDHPNTQTVRENLEGLGG